MQIPDMPQLVSTARRPQGLEWQARASLGYTLQTRAHPRLKMWQATASVLSYHTTVHTVRSAACTPSKVGLTCATVGP